MFYYIYGFSSITPIVFYIHSYAKIIDTNNLRAFYALAGKTRCDRCLYLVDMYGRFMLHYVVYSRYE